MVRNRSAADTNKRLRTNLRRSITKAARILFVLFVVLQAIQFFAYVPPIDTIPIDNSPESFRGGDRNSINSNIGSSNSNIGSHGNNNNNNNNNDNNKPIDTIPTDNSPKSFRGGDRNSINNNIINSNIGSSINSSDTNENNSKESIEEAVATLPKATNIFWDDDDEVLPMPSTGTTERYKVRKFVHTLPQNSTHHSLLESLVRDHLGHDEAWYQACDTDNANKWRQTVKNRGGVETSKYFDRACPNKDGMVLHPQGIQANPLQTRDHNCSATSRIELVTHRDHFWEDWTIRTLDAKGVPKTIGGDTFYIVYSEYDYGEGSNDTVPPMAVALPTDHYDGTYGLEFVTVPFWNQTAVSKHNGQRKKGRLTIHAITTCFIGQLYPPLKDGWNTGGQTNVVWTVENVSRPYKIQDWYSDRYAPRYRKEALKQHSKIRNNNLSGFDRVVFAGDSVLTQMVWGGNSYHPFVASNIQTGRIVAGPTEEDGSPVVLHMPLSPKTFAAFSKTLDSFISAGLEDKNEMGNSSSSSSGSSNNNHTSVGDSTENTNATKTALVVGSSAWDIIWPAEWQGPNFDNHLSAVESLLLQLRKAHPGVTLVWKLPYAHHAHAVNDHDRSCFANHDGACVNDLRYATRERFENLHRIQKEFIESKFGHDPMVVLLDLYEVSYLAGARWMVDDDSLHYQPEFNALVIEKLLYAESP